MNWDCIVIGAGQSGLAAGYALKQMGLSFTLLDRHDQLGGSWQDYFKSLTLFSPARYAALPGMAFPGDPAHYPHRDEVIAYLRRYATGFDLPVVLGTSVERIERSSEGFCLSTNQGSYTAKSLIAASGPFNTPYMPTITGREIFQGQVLHAYDYKEAAPYVGQHVVVIGARESAIQIAVELSHVARVTLATRRPLQFVPQRILGLDIHFFLHATRFDTLPVGLWTTLEGSKRIVEVGRYRDALKTGNPRRRAMFERFTERGVMWNSGEQESVDTIIFATGYRPGLDYLKTLPGALDEQGYPCHRGGVSLTVPGLFYVGLFGQRSHASATLRGVGRDARDIAAKIARLIRS